MADSRLDRIKTLTIIALVSDDELMERLVLKGGNAIKFTDASPVRRSLDLDFSLDGDLGPIDEVRSRIEQLLVETFHPEGLVVMDVKFEKAPPNIGVDTLGDFWGGYSLEFKVITQADHDRLALQPERRRIQALALGSGDRRAFKVDISKHEYVAGKVAREVDGFTVYVYTPLMIVCEKIRAICQQMPEYREIVLSSSARPRARDFFDIHHLVVSHGIDLSAPEAWETLVKMFEVKRVPLDLLGRISSSREYHRENFRSVKDTVPAGYQLLSFDEYVEFLVGLLRPLETRWKEESPST